MSWFSPVSIARIKSSKKYYFLTDDHVEKGFFKIYDNKSINITADSIKSLPESGDFLAVPREIIDILNPSQDFTLKTTIKYGSNSHNFREFALGDILTDSTYADPKSFTIALLSSGEECIDLGDSLGFLSCAKIIPKCIDENVLSKLTLCLNKAIYNVVGFNPSTFEVATKDVNIQVEVKLASKLREQLNRKTAVKFNLGKSNE